MQIDQRDVHFPGDAADRFGIVTVRIDDASRRVERATVHRREQYRNCLAVTRSENELPQRSGKGRERANAFALLFHVIVAELDEQIIAGLDLAKDLLQPLLRHEAAQRLTGMRMICYRQARLEEAWQHLPPPGPRLLRL